MNDKTVEAVGKAMYDVAKAMYNVDPIASSYCWMKYKDTHYIPMAQAAIAAHDSELKKHIKVLVEALVIAIHYVNAEVSETCSMVTQSEVLEHCEEAVASLPEELLIRFALYDYVISKED